MKQKLINWVISGLLGFLGCLWFTDKGCLYVPQESKIIDNTWIEHHTDTIYIPVPVEVPKPKTVYQTVYKDSIPNWVFDFTIDSLGDTLVTIPYNMYIDSIETSEYKFTYSAEVMGELVSLNPVITLYQDSTAIIREEKVFIPKIPDWGLTVGVSNRLNFYTGVSYKGWGLGTEYNFNRINQFYITKTFKLN